MSAAMRVAFATPATLDDVRGGGERYPTNIARGLVRVSGGAVEVEIVAPSARSFRRRVDEGVTVRGCRTDSPGGGYGEALSWEMADALLEADVVHVHQVFTLLGEAVVLLARAFRRVVCVTDHGGRPSLTGRRLGLLELADGIVAYSQFGARALETRCPVTVVEGGVDTAFFHPGATPSRRAHVLFVGRILPHKGVDLLVRACPSDVPLVIAGTAGDPDYLAYVSDLARARDVRFVLDASDAALRDLYRDAIAVVAPSVHLDHAGRWHAHPELMGLTMLEGMACGTPAVCMRTGALPEYVEDGVTGYVAAGEAELGRRIAALAGDRDLAGRLGAAARERVAREWDMGVSAGRFLALYRGLLER